MCTCEDCAATHPLDSTGSSDPDGDTLNYSWSVEDDALEDYSTSAVANVFLPATPAEYDVDTTAEYDITLSVNDCSLDDTDKMTLAHICRGIYVLPDIPWSPIHFFGNGHGRIRVMSACGGEKEGRRPIGTHAKPEATSRFPAPQPSTSTVQALMTPIAIPDLPLGIRYGA